MSDKTELTREEVERLGSTVGGSPLAVEVLPGTWRWYRWPPPPEWEQALAMAPVAYHQLLATMDELAEARATLAAERGEAEGAPGEGWVCEEGDWVKGLPSGCHAIVRRCSEGYPWGFGVWAGRSDHTYACGGDAPDGAREAMRAADAALATTEPPDAG